MSLIHQAHKLIKTHFEQTNTAMSLAVDATCGNGHDTLFLCQFGFKKVLGFDVQQVAIDASRALLEKNEVTNSIELIHAGHQQLAEKISLPIDCIMFNLGYLPKADKSVTTQALSTLSALEQACKLLSDNGLISLLCYPGHDEGKIETEQVKGWLTQISDSGDWQVDTHQSSVVKETSPILYIITHSTQQF